MIAENSVHIVYLKKNVSFASLCFTYFAHIRLDWLQIMFLVIPERVFHSFLSLFFIQNLINVHLLINDFVIEKLFREFDESPVEIVEFKKRAEIRCVLVDF